MVICKFFLEGRCRFGDGCKNEHPQNNNNQNRFAPLQNGQRGRSGAFGGNAGQGGKNEFSVSTDLIRIDLKEGADGERPIWPFSAYGPGIQAPRQLLEGPIEQSAEEMRVQYYLKQASGQQQDYINSEQALLNQVNSQIQNIVSNPEAAKTYVLEGQNAHPNRNDMCDVVSETFPWINRPKLGQQQQSGGFGATSTPAATGGFGAPSSLGAQKPAFGAPSAPASGFSAASALGGNSPFSKPPAPAGGGGFGQTSALGSNASPFGQSAQPGGFAKPAQPGFGQSGFGAAAKPAFGAASQPGQSAFGQPSQPSAFGGGGAFGKPSGLGANASPFGAAVQNQNQQPASNPFAAATQNQSQQPASNPFAAAGAPKPNPFGASTQQPSSNPFAPKPAATGAFGAPSQPGVPSINVTHPTPPTSTSTFGGSSNTGFGAPSNTVRPNPFAPTTANGTTVPAGPFGTTWRAQHFHNRPIIKSDKGTPCLQNPQDSKLDRVWFPDGPVHNETAYVDREAEQGVYEGELGKTLKELYDFAKSEGAFKYGVMPEVPPKLEWIDWDL